MSTLEPEKITAGTCTVNVHKQLDLPKKPILLLHGASFSARTWSELGTLERLTTAGYPVLAVDMPGYGESPSCTADKGELLHTLITEFNLKQPILVGPSLGARYSLKFITAYPEMVGGLVLIGAVGIEQNKELFKDIRVPCCLFWGSEDSISPPQNAEFVHQEISTSTLHIIAGAGHACYLDEPQTWHRELLRFLEHHFSA